MNLQPLEVLLNTSVPDMIAVLYARPSEIEDTALMRLMDPCEAADTTQAMRDSWLALNPDLVVLWTDDNSNYAGVYFRGELAPRVTLLDHEETEDTPRYFSAASFTAARHTGAKLGLDWSELPTDYPVISPSAYATIEIDRALGLKYLEQYQRAPQDSRQLAYYAMNLLPPAEMPMVSRQFLWSEDMWVQERACQVMGRRKYAPAVGDLHQVALQGAHNGRVAALLALKRIGNSQARQALASLQKELGSSFAPYFR